MESDEDIDDSKMEDEAYSKLVNALTEIIIFEDITYDDLNIFTGKLRVDFFDLLKGTNIHILSTFQANGEDENIFKLEIWYISENDLKDFYEINDEFTWYSNIFVPGKGMRTWSYDTDEDSFEEVSVLLKLPGREELENIITLEKQQLRIQKTKYRIACKNTLLERNSPIEVEKIFFNDFNCDRYSLGKLTKNFLDLKVGDNILVEWEDNLTFEDLTDYYPIIIYSISDFDRDMFHLLNEDYFWYQHIYVPGKKIGKYYYNYNEERIVKEEDTTPFFNKIIEDKILLSGLSLPLMFGSENNILYYGITLSEFYDIPKNYLLVILNGDNSTEKRLVYIPLHVGLEYGLSWFLPEICIVEKRSKII